MPLTTNDSITTSSAKRRRADSPINHRQISEMPTITLDQLKLQYKNLSVRIKWIWLFVWIDLLILGRRIEKTSSND
jgi:hypothetical protein